MISPKGVSVTLKIPIGCKGHSQQSSPIGNFICTSSWYKAGGTKSFIDFQITIQKFPILTAFCLFFLSLIKCGAGISHNNADSFPPPRTFWSGAFHSNNRVSWPWRLGHLGLELGWGPRPGGPHADLCRLQWLGGSYSQVKQAWGCQRAWPACLPWALEGSTLNLVTSVDCFTSSVS